MKHTLHLCLLRSFSDCKKIDFEILRIEQRRQCLSSMFTEIPDLSQNTNILTFWRRKHGGSHCVQHIFGNFWEISLLNFVSYFTFQLVSVKMKQRTNLKKYISINNFMYKNRRYLFSSLEWDMYMYLTTYYSQKWKWLVVEIYWATKCKWWEN